MKVFRGFRFFKILLSIFLISSANCYAQQPIKYIGIEQGLSNNAATCIYKDHYGFMWIGTYDGLNRFDGNNRPALTESVMSALDGRAKNTFGLAERIDICGIEHRHASVEADINQPSRFGRIGRAPCGEAPDAAESARPKAERGYSKS